MLNTPVLYQQSVYSQEEWIIICIAQMRSVIRVSSARDWRSLHKIMMQLDPI